MTTETTAIIKSTIEEQNRTIKALESRGTQKDRSLAKMIRRHMAMLDGTLSKVGV